MLKILNKKIELNKIHLYFIIFQNVAGQLNFEEKLTLTTFQNKLNFYFLYRPFAIKQTVLISRQQLTCQLWTERELELYGKDYILRCFIFLFSMLVLQNLPLHCFLGWPCFVQLDSVFQPSKIYTNNNTEFPFPLSL